MRQPHSYSEELVEDKHLFTRQLGSQGHEASKTGVEICNNSYLLSLVSLGDRR